MYSDQNIKCLDLTVYWGTDEKSIKAPRHWSLWGEVTADRWIPRTKGQ